MRDTSDRKGGQKSTEMHGSGFAAGPTEARDALHGPPPFAPSRRSQQLCRPLRPLSRHRKGLRGGHAHTKPLPCASPPPPPPPSIRCAPAPPSRSLNAANPHSCAYPIAPSLVVAGEHFYGGIQCFLILTCEHCSASNFGEAWAVFKVCRPAPNVWTCRSTGAGDRVDSTGRAAPAMGVFSCVPRPATKPLGHPQHEGCSPGPFSCGGRKGIPPARPKRQHSDSDISGRQAEPGKMHVARSFGCRWTSTTRAEE